MGMTLGTALLQCENIIRDFADPNSPIPLVNAMLHCSTYMETQSSCGFDSKISSLSVCFHRDMGSCRCSPMDQTEVDAQEK